MNCTNYIQRLCKRKKATNPWSPALTIHKAIKVHPDKVEESKKASATAEFQVLNNSYERLLKFLVDKVKKNKDIAEQEDIDEKSEEERFTEDNFKNFNFPTENDGSFTVNIQHSHADSWQENLENIYGAPTIHKNNKGTVGDTYWQFKYSVEEQETVITLHIYNKPKNKKSSKLMIQSGNKSLVCIFVFSELPRIYTNLSTSTAIVEDERTQNMVKCTQCKVKASIAGMRMHLKKAHSTSRSLKISKKPTKNQITDQITEQNKIEIKCDRVECN